MPVTPPENSCNTATLPARTAAQWRARFERRAAEQMFVEGYERTAARCRAFYEVLVDWVAHHPDVDALPNSQAEQVARMALAEIGIFEPKGVSR